jgi:hypothetical protein
LGNNAWIWEQTDKARILSGVLKFWWALKLLIGF